MEEDSNITIANVCDKTLLPKGVEKSQEEIDAILSHQESRRVSAFEASKLEKEAKKNWDIFYKRNETRFFKDRHWTLREFQEILDWRSDGEGSGPTLLEVGCGCGNFAIPLLEEIQMLRVYACDFSPRAVEFVKSHANYDERRMKAFVCDITEKDCFQILHSPKLAIQSATNSSDSISNHHESANATDITQDQHSNSFRGLDFVSMIFVLSAISPSNHSQTVDNISKVVKPGGIVFFRDYGRYDMAQLRFKGGNKIDENFYVRRDRTRAYYFRPEEVESLFICNGQFRKLQCEFVHRRTVNVKENVDVSRIFVQGKFIKV